jgi:hypothetical protein
VCARLRQERPELAATAPGNVRFEILMAMDRNPSAKILPAGYRSEPVVATELGLGLVGEDAAQQRILSRSWFTRQPFKLSELAANPPAKHLAGRPRPQHSFEY